MAYTFVVTYLIIFVIDHIPGLKVRCTEEQEILGIDETEASHSPSLSLSCLPSPSPFLHPLSFSPSLPVKKHP